MQYSIKAPRELDATIDLPASKSISNRVLIIHALSEGSIPPSNLSRCDDTEVMVAALRDMPPEIDIKAAGTAMRFMTAYLAVTRGEHVITGTERMCHRPIKVLVDALRYMGADIEYMGEEGYPPLRIRGKQLEGGLLSISGHVSSQYISALLMIGAVLEGGLQLQLTGEIVSRPYIDLTLCTMREYGAKVDWTDKDTISIQPQSYISRPYLIENDWSAASYWYEIMALSGLREASVRMTGLRDGSRQGDSVVRYLFSLLGVKSAFASKEPDKDTTVTLSNHLNALPRMDYDFINQPDLTQTLAVSCCLRGIPFHFTGLGNLRIKETDRIEALQTELRKLGFVVKETNGNELIWDGERCETMPCPVIDTYEDHRMAMAFAPASFLVPGLRINDPAVVTKSYPHFWDDLKLAGFEITEQ